MTHEGVVEGGEEEAGNCGEEVGVKDEAVEGGGVGMVVVEESIDGEL